MHLVGLCLLSLTCIAMSVYGTYYMPMGYAGYGGGYGVGFGGSGAGGGFGGIFDILVFLFVFMVIVGVLFNGDGGYGYSGNGYGGSKNQDVYNTKTAVYDNKPAVPHYNDNSEWNNNGHDCSTC